MSNIKSGKRWWRICLQPGFDQKYSAANCATSSLEIFLLEILKKKKKKVSHNRYVFVTYVPPLSAPLSVFVSQLYFSCKVTQLQLASIWQGLLFFFFCLVQRWKVIFIGLISLKDNENRDCLQRLGPWKWSNQCFEKGTDSGGLDYCL